MGVDRAVTVEAEDDDVGERGDAVFAVVRRWTDSQPAGVGCSGLPQFWQR